MRNNGAAVLLIAVLAVFGAKYVPSVPREPGRKAEPAAGEKLVGGTTPAAAPAGLRSRIDAAESPECSCLPPGDGDQDYLIVTLPDPFISSSGYRFDSLVDALQRAVETQHYVLDSYCYPWKSGVKQPERRLGIAFSLETGSWKDDALLAMTTQTDRKPPNAFPSYQGKPGILVFRQTDDASCPKRRVIFLVGETATRGIDKEAFLTSLTWIEKHKGNDPNKQIRVLGPYFSGAQTSLIQAITKWKNRPGNASFKITIVSGSTRGIKGGDIEKCFCDRSVTFQTTVHSEIVLKTELMKYL